MHRDFLNDYLNREIETCKVKFEGLDRAMPGRLQLQSIYGMEPQRPTVYCESGGVRNLPDFPPYVLLVVPIFPYRTPADLEKHLGPSRKILKSCLDHQRILPVVQHPGLYEGLQHLAPFFTEIQSPCYFVRGQFAYAALLGIEPELVFTGSGIPVLRQIDDLMQHCGEKHKLWIEGALKNQDCWEHRYRAQGSRDDRFFQQLRRSMRYRYASVALWVGQNVADQIIEIFDTVRASKILLHLHIVFDHVICHGFGSDFVVAPNSPDGKDYLASTPGLVKKVEMSLVRGLSVLLPRRKRSWIKGLLREEHFLRNFDFQHLTRENLGAAKVKLHNQFANFNKKVQRLEKSEQLVERTFSLAFFGMGLMDVANEEALRGIAEIIAGTEQSGIPGCLADNVVLAIRRVYEHNLGSYLISGGESGWVQ